jgi:hypothetical protein
MAGKRARRSKLKPFLPGEERRFDNEPITVAIAASGGQEWEFTDIVAVMKADNMFVYLEKTNGNLIEIPPGYFFLELGDPNDEEEPL